MSAPRGSMTSDAAYDSLSPRRGTATTTTTTTMSSRDAKLARKRRTALDKADDLTQAELVLAAFGGGERVAVVGNALVALHVLERRGDERALLPVDEIAEPIGIALLDEQQVLRRACVGQRARRSQHRRRVPAGARRGTATRAATRRQTRCVARVWVRARPHAHRRSRRRRCSTCDSS